MLVLGGMAAARSTRRRSMHGGALPEITWRTLGLGGGPGRPIHGRIFAQPTLWSPMAARTASLTSPPAGRRSCCLSRAVRRTGRHRGGAHSTRTCGDCRRMAQRRGLAKSAGRARASDPRKWEQWQTAGAAARAAKAIETAASPFGARAPYEDRRHHHGPWPARHLRRQLLGIAAVQSVPTFTSLSRSTTQPLPKSWRRVGARPTSCSAKMARDR